MKKTLFFIALSLLVFSCDKLKEATGKVTGLQGSIEADVFIDGDSTHYKPSVLNVQRVKDFFTAIATEIDISKTITLIGTYPAEGTFSSASGSDAGVSIRTGASNSDQTTFDSSSNENAVSTVVITKRDGKVLEGTFTATIYNSEGKKCEIRNGVFKVTATL